MSITLPGTIFNLRGQRVKEIYVNEANNCLTCICNRDHRYKIIDSETGSKGTVNRYIRRVVKDLPISSYRCAIEIELAEVRLRTGKRRIEHCDFVDKGCYYTRRFCYLISGLCRHMCIKTVAKHFELRWETVKNMDKYYLQSTLPALDPAKLTGLMYIGVDEVARAKGHDYMTVVYDLVSGTLIWVERGRTSEVFAKFLKQLPNETADKIRGVAMDMGPAYQLAVKSYLPNADIIFDRFHVMQNYSKAISNQRRIEFRKANTAGKELIKGSRYLLLKNSDKLNEEQKKKLERLLKENKNINTIYILKEQLQELWSYKTYDEMVASLEAWCKLANQTEMHYIKKFAELLQRHKVGICNYAKHRLTTARIEAGNVGIGMIRKRARGIRDTEYFKLKIRQLSVVEIYPIFYKKCA